MPKSKRQKKSVAPLRLTHVTPDGAAQMVGVGQKAETLRSATARAFVVMSPGTLAQVRRAALAKGDVIAVARVAALMALKRTSELIPLCHPVRVVGSTVVIRPQSQPTGLAVEVTVEAFDRTGVEMEAMVGASAAALTIYDMVKGIEREVAVSQIILIEKRGGRSGLWQRPPGQSPQRRGTKKGQ